MQERNIDIPILLTTGYDQDLIKTKFGNDLYYDLVQKPYLSDDLLHHVRELLDHSIAT